MPTPQCRIAAVSDDGFVAIDWGDGLLVTHPVPIDEAGAVLAGNDLQQWLADRYIQDIRPRQSPPSVTGLKTMISQSFTPLQPAIDSYHAALATSAAAAEDDRTERDRIAAIITEVLDAREQNSGD